MKVAIVYDRVNKWGGAERTLLALNKIFPNAPLFTSLYNPKRAPWAKVFPEVKTSFLQKFPSFLRHHEILPFLMPLAFESFKFDTYDLVISVTSEAAKGVITKPGTRHICLCLTPTRYLWSGYEEYFSNSLFRFIAKPAIIYLRMWDKIAAYRPDIYAANSEEVKKRIKKYYNQDASVIYPPVAEEWQGRKKNVKNAQHFLVVGRLSRFTSYKRIDLAIKACTELGLPLVVVGAGDIPYFKRFAGPTVSFVGEVSDERLHELYLGAKALLFPGFEDFGMVMVEANLHGVPVIAYDKGGSKEIVRPGITGELFEKQHVDSLCAALKTFDSTKYNKRVCTENAMKFSEEKFIQQVRILAQSTIVQEKKIK